MGNAKRTAKGHDAGPPVLLDSYEAKLRRGSPYRMLFDAGPFPTVVVDYETRRLVATNDATVKYYGWSRAELLTMKSDDFYLPEDQPLVRAAHQTLVSGAPQDFAEVRHRKKDRTIVRVYLTVRPIEFGGRPSVLATVFDMTERNKTMNELRQSEERYHALVDTLPVGVLETTAEGLIVTANGAWRRIFGFGDGEDLRSVNVRDLYADSGERTVVMARVNAGDLPGLPETTFKRRDGTRFAAERYASTVVDGKGKVVGLRGIVIDISDRKAIEAQLRQAQKMEAVGQLTGGIAHDFNNILTIIMANADALQEEEVVAPAVASRLDEIAKAVQRAADLTRQLLAFSRRQPLRPQATDINELVAGTGKLLRRSLGEQIELDSTLSASLWSVNVDRSQLETALVNLCINARDAMPAGGKLHIETRNTTFDEDYIAKNPDATAGDYAMIAVTDTGTGMPPDILAKVFEPFFTTKEVGKGTGLGLSMVYGFIKQSNGHIRLYSEIGRGATFELYLPRGATVQQEAAVQVLALPRGDERILVVEDEEAVRKTIVEQLTSLGYAVDEAPDAKAGLATFEAAAQPHDLLVTDVVMPGSMSGKALADEVSRRWPETKILYASGYAESALVYNGTLDADVLLLSKPFRKRELALTVREALDQPRARVRRSD